MSNALRSQVERCRTPLLWCYLFGALLFAVVLVLKFAYGVPTKFFLYDPAELDDLVPTVPLPASFAGMVSNIGIVLWGVAAGVALFSRFLIESRPHRGESEVREPRRFLLGFALISTLFLLDDLLTLHERIAAQTFATEALLQAMLALLLVAFLAVFHRLILQGAWLVLALALAMFAGSVLIDVALLFPGKILIEDGLKFFGILSWVVFIVVEGRELIMQRGAGQ